jgi:hypothetical protein
MDCIIYLLIPVSLRDAEKRQTKPTVFIPQTMLELIEEDCGNDKITLRTLLFLGREGQGQTNDE